MVSSARRGPGPRTQTPIAAPAAAIQPFHGDDYSPLKPSKPAEPLSAPRLHSKQDLSPVSPSLVMGPHASHPQGRNTSIVMSISPSPRPSRLAADILPDRLSQLHPECSTLQPERSSSREHLPLCSHLLNQQQLLTASFTKPSSPALSLRTAVSPLSAECSVQRLWT